MLRHISHTRPQTTPQQSHVLLLLLAALRVRGACHTNAAAVVLLSSV